MFSPIGETLRLNPPELLEPPLHVEPVRSRIHSVNVPQKALKLLNLLATDVVEYLEDGEVSPQVAQYPGMCAKPPSDGSSREPDVNDIITTRPRPPAKECVQPSGTGGHVPYLSSMLELRTAFEQLQFGLWHRITKTNSPKDVARSAVFVRASIAEHLSVYPKIGNAEPVVLVKAERAEHVPVRVEDLKRVRDKDPPMVEPGVVVRAEAQHVHDDVGTTVLPSKRYDMGTLGVSTGECSDLLPTYLT